VLSFEEVVARLKDIISAEVGERRVLDKDVAETLGIAPSYFAVLKKRESLPLAAIADFCALRKISINWLLYDQMPRSLEESTEKVATIRYFKEVSVSAGGGAINWNEAYETILAKASGPLDAIKVSGDSMEPLLKNGDIVVLDRERKVLVEGHIYVVRIKDELFVKMAAFKKDRTELLSINPVYMPILLDEESEVLGEALGVVEF